MKVAALAAVLAIAFLTGACEKQSYADTRTFTHHGEHAGSGHEATSHDAAHGATAPTEAGAAEQKPASH